VAKKISEEEAAKLKKDTDQFRKHVNWLESLYSRTSLAQNLGQTKGNFSNYVNGRWPVPKELIALFYQKYKRHLEWHKVDVEELSNQEVKEATNRYGLGIQLELVLQELKEIREKIDALPAGQDVANLSARVENLEKQVLPPTSPSQDNA
jgi:hypothetical protein